MSALELPSLKGSRPVRDAPGGFAARVAAPVEGAEAVVRCAALEMGPNWTVVRGNAARKAVGRDGVDFLYAFLHPDHGVALVGASYDPDAVARFKRGFAAAGFAAEFGGWPPVVHRALPPSDVPLAEVLQAAFALEPAPALLTGDKHWLEAARRLLTPPVPDFAQVPISPDVAAAREPAVAGLGEVRQSAGTSQAGSTLRRRGWSRALASAGGLLALVVGGVVFAWRFEAPGPGVADSVQVGEDTTNREPSVSPQEASRGCGSDARACGDFPAPLSGHAALAAGAEDGGTSEAGSEPASNGARVEREPSQRGQAPAEDVSGSPSGAAANPPSDHAALPAGWVEDRRGEAGSELLPDAAHAEQEPEQLGPALAGGAVGSSTSAVADPPSGHAVLPAEAAEARRSDADFEPALDAARAEREPGQSDRAPAGSVAGLPPGAVAGSISAATVPYPAGASNPEAPSADALSTPGPVRGAARTPDGSSPQEPDRPSLADGATQLWKGVPQDDEPNISVQGAPTNETAAPGTAAVNASQPATKPQRPSSAASPAFVAALLARGDALIAVGDVAAARLVYQRAAALASVRAVTSAGKTYDPRFLQAIGAIGVVADPDAAAGWYRKGAALGDVDAAQLLIGLNEKARQ